VKHFHWKHKNILFFALGLLSAYVIFKNPQAKAFFLKTGDWDFLGAFIAGIFFTFTFSLPIGALILIDIAKDLPILPVIVCAALGAAFFDFIIFKFFRHTISKEIAPLYDELEKIGHKGHFKKILHTKYFGWTLPVFGAIIMATPLPDELGVSLMGISKITALRFLLISFCSHSIGMFLVVSAAALL